MFEEILLYLNLATCLLYRHYIHVKLNIAVQNFSKYPNFWPFPFRIKFSLVAQMVKNLPAMQETWALSLIREDLLEKGMAIHSSILAWRIPWTEEPGRLRSIGLQRVGHNWACTCAYQRLHPIFKFMRTFETFMLSKVCLFDLFLL